MHASELSRLRAKAASMHMRMELSDPIKSAALAIAENSRQIASDDDELFTDMLGTGVGMSIVMIIDMLARKYPSLIEDPACCIENWLDCLARGMNSAQEQCDCDQCKRERL
jgi:hypothetical protein